MAPPRPLAQTPVVQPFYLFAFVAFMKLAQSDLAELQFLLSYNRIGSL